MGELITSIIAIAFVVSGLVIVTVVSGAVYVMLVNVNEGETFSFFNFLPVFEKKVLNEKGKAARRVYNRWFFIGCTWIVLFLVYQSVIE